MDASELQTIINAVVQLGEQGKAAFIWWLVLDKLVPVVAWTTVGSVALKLISDLVCKTVMEGRCERALQDMRDNLRIGAPGNLTTSELRETNKQVHRLIAEKEQQS